MAEINGAYDLLRAQAWTPSTPQRPHRAARPRPAAGRGAWLPR